jgi:hypothetical protein
MKIKIKTYNGELPSYLTVGKVYEVEIRWFNRKCIMDDTGYSLSFNIENCNHLNGGSWEIINE